jgi:hypothetical protein
MPIFYAFTFTFDLNQYFSFDSKLIIGLSLPVIIFSIGAIILWHHQKDYKKKVMNIYRKEYAGIMLVTGFGILGVTVMFLEYGGEESYILHLLILLFLINYFVVFELGRLIFNVKLFQNR